jgi:hypothetical protein
MIADALKDTVRRVNGMKADAELLLLAGSRFNCDPGGFRKYEDKHANIISDVDFFGRIEESGAIVRVLARMIPLELRPRLETARGMLLDFSGVNFSRRSMVNTDDDTARHVTVVGGDFTNSMWDCSSVNSFTFSECRFNGASWNGAYIARCALIDCEGYAIDLQHATVHNSIFKHVKLGFSNTEELEVYETGFYGLSLGDFPRENGTYYKREIVVRSTIATTHFLGPATRNFGLETISFEGESFATEAQRNMLLELRHSNGIADSDIRHLVFTVNEVQRSAETAGPTDRVYKSARKHSAEGVTRFSGS